MVTLYGIANCDSVKKGRRWLDEAGVDHTFHDYKKAGVPEAALREWVTRLGWPALLNRQGTTFRNLPVEQKTDLDGGRAVALMLAHPSAIRRPVLVAGKALVVGVDPAGWAAALDRGRASA